MDDLFAGKLAERSRIIRSVPTDYEIVGYDADIRRVSLLHSDDDIAVCDCDARLRVERLEKVGVIPNVSRNAINGPVTLSNVEGRWKITDYTVNGLSISSCFRLYDATSFAYGDYVFTPRLLERFPGQLSLASTLTNESPGTASVVEGRLWARRRFRTEPRKAYLRSASEIEAGAARTFDAGWGLDPRHAPDPLRFEFVIASSLTESVHFAFQLDSEDERETLTQPS